MRAEARATRRKESGFVLISVAALLVGLIAFLGLAFDIGDLQWTRRRLQIAADSAANAATREILAGSSPSVIVSAAKADAALNGFTDGSAGVTVTINNPPKTGYDTTNSQAVEAIVAQNVHVYFLAIFGKTTAPVHARGVSKTAPGTDCVYILSPSGSKAFSIGGTVSISLSCGAITNSSDSTGMSANGSVTFTGQAAVVGGYSTTGSVQWNPAPPQTGVDAQNDPLSYISPPAIGACDFIKYKASGTYNVTLNPGVYCNGMSFSGGGTITFNPGTYILLGGGLTITGGVTMNGTGVTFYNTQGSGYSYGPVSISGAANSTLTAPTAGPLAGILFFQDRTIASPGASSIAGTSSDNFIGALYFPTSDLTYSGVSGGQYTILVSKTLTLNGAATVGANYSSLAGGSPLRSTAVLSE
jgi:Flp pilus assembly protein TadG